ncbi:hypothetical protein [Bradyrhizobium sp. RT10b]|uniref:hypothetical protein n=1 Tax=Bradyrhizobium sp. RT10b TaxID=3156331 RepID=UPI0033988C70
MIRLIKHEKVPGTGSFEVRFADSRRSVYFYFDELPSRRLRQQMVRNEALDWAKMFARIMSGIIGGWSEGKGPPQPESDQ